MKRTMQFILVCAITLLLSSAAMAVDERWFQPRADFSAKLIMIMKQVGGGMTHKMECSVNATADGMERRKCSQNGRSIVVVENHVTGDSATLLPDQKMVMRDTDDSADDPRQMVRDGTMTVTEEGFKTVNGLKTRVLHMKSKDGAEEEFDGEAYFTKKHNVPVLMKATSRSGNMVYQTEMIWSDHVFEKQPRHLFKVPDWTTMHSGQRLKAPPGSGHKDIKLPPGLTQDQIDKIKKAMGQE